MFGQEINTSKLRALLSFLNSPLVSLKSAPFNVDQTIDSVVICFYIGSLQQVVLACENSRPYSLAARVALREEDVCDFNTAENSILMT